MPTTQKNETQVARKILATFAQYGFRKTSMENIATAAGVSRQSIYKKFGSKEKCYTWTIRTYLTDMYARIFAAMSNEEIDPRKTLTKVFDILIGEAVGTVNNPHGTEVLDATLKATHASEEDWPLRFRARLADFLSRNHFASNDNASGVAYTLISASKGLLVEEASRERFTEAMTEIIDSIIKQNR